jgi:hypothetical protein
MTKRKIGFTKQPTFLSDTWVCRLSFLYLLKERSFGQAVHQTLTTVFFVAILVALQLQQRRRARRTLRDPYFLGGALRPYRIAGSSTKNPCHDECNPFCRRFERFHLSGGCLHQAR